MLLLDEKCQWRIYIVKFWTRAPPGGPNSFNFMQFLGNFGKIVCWRPPWGVAPPPRGNPGSATECICNLFLFSSRKRVKLSHCPPKCASHIYSHLFRTEFMHSLWLIGLKELHGFSLSKSKNFQCFELTLIVSISTFVVLFLF